MELLYGTISERDSEKALLRVNFDQDGIVSAWLPFLVPKTKEDSFFVLPDVGETAVVLMQNNDFGIVIGCIYTDKTAPKISGDDKTAVVFSDGTEIEYDRTAKNLRLKLVGELNIEANKDVNIKSSKNIKAEGVNVTAKASVKVTIDAPTAEFTGNITVSGNVTANGDVKAGGGAITLLLHKHLGVTPGVGITGTPIP